MRRVVGYRPSGKPIVLGYDEIIVSPSDTSECEYCLKANEVEALLAVLEPLAWSTRWYSEIDTPIDQATITNFRNDLMRKLMSCCDQTIPIITRVDPTNNYNVQISYDGGATFIDNPEQPRLNMTILIPAVTSGVSSTKCDAASNALQHIKDAVEKESDDMLSGATVINLALLIVTFLVGLWVAPEVDVPVVAPVLLAAISAIFSLGHDDFVAYWTSDVYDKVLCALFCHIKDDGSFDLAAFAGVTTDLTTNLPASPAKDWLIGILLVGGEKGLTNFAAYGSSADADCSGCDCGECDTSQWGVLTNGTLVTSDEVSVTMQGTFSAGAYRLDFTSHISDFDPDTHFSTNCCNWTWEATLGSIDTEIHDIECGGSYNSNLEGGITGGAITSGSYTGGKVWLVEFNSSVPFTVVFTVA